MVTQIEITAYFLTQNNLPSENFLFLKKKTLNMVFYFLRGTKRKYSPKKRVNAIDALAFKQRLFNALSPRVQQHSVSTT